MGAFFIFVIFLLIIKNWSSLEQKAAYDGKQTPKR